MLSSHFAAVILLALSAVALGQVPPDAFQTGTASNLNVMDSLLNINNISNTALCVNTYAFDALSSEIKACCTSLMAPKTSKNVSVRKGIISNTLTPAVPTSIVIKLVASTPNAGVCNPAIPSPFANLTSGLMASLQPPPVPFQLALFDSVPNSPNNPTTMATDCTFILDNGSGFGVCDLSGSILASPPTLTKSFSPTAIPPGGISVLTLHVTNAINAVGLTGVVFTDTLPAGLQVATPNGLTTTCSGTATAVAGTGFVSLSGASLDLGASCTVSVNVTSTTVGPKTNTAGPITSTQSGSLTGFSNSATLFVQQPPVLSKAFSSPQLYYFTGLNHTSLSFTVSNPAGNVTLNNITFTDTLPAGIVVNSPNALAGSCPGGTVSAVAGSNSIGLTGASLAPGSSCSFSVDVRGVGLGPQVNTTSIITADGGSAGAPASAAVFVNSLYYLWYFGG